MLDDMLAFTYSACFCLRCRALISAYLDLLLCAGLIAPCYAVLCCAVPYCAVLCCAVPCLAVLRLLSFQRGAVMRTYENPKNIVFPYVYTPYLVLIITFPRQ